MSNQTKAYIEDMKKMYEIIAKKYVNSGELAELDLLFLQAYKQTIDNNVSIGL